MCYEYGIGVERNTNKSFDIYQRLTSYFSSFEAYNIARCYEEGIGCKVNIGESQRLYRQAANKGNVDSMIKLIEYEEDKVLMMNVTLTK